MAGTYVKNIMKIEILNKQNLSPREVDTLSLTAYGLSNRDISDKMNVALETTRGRLSRVYRKLGAKNRTHALALAVSKGIISIYSVLLMFLVHIPDAEMRRKIRDPRRKVAICVIFNTEKVYPYHIPYPLS